MADIIIRPEQTTQVSPTAVRWTRHNCEEFERAGVLNYRYELVLGVINRMPENLAHGQMVRLIMGWLVVAFGIDFFFTQMTIDVRPIDNPTNAPEPDATVLNHSATELSDRPTPADICLLIEAADTTLDYDLTTKAALYARAGIIDYWVLSLLERKLYVHRRPLEGGYQEISIYREGEVIAPLAAPDKSVDVTALLPPVSN